MKRKRVKTINERKSKNKLSILAYLMYNIFFDCDVFNRTKGFEEIAKKNLIRSVRDSV